MFRPYHERASALIKDIILKNNTALFNTIVFFLNKQIFLVKIHKYRLYFFMLKFNDYLQQNIAMGSLASKSKSYWCNGV